MPERKVPGSLESELLGLLARADEPLTPSDLQQRLREPLAYTTVGTVLSRLHGKRLVKRSRAARGFAYELAVDEAALVADRMRADLRRAGDEALVLLRFVSELDTDEASALRSVLEELESS